MMSIAESTEVASGMGVPQLEERTVSLRRINGTAILFAVAHLGGALHQRSRTCSCR